MVERGLPRKDIPLRYPTDLVHRYGAKAGVLLYIADALPEIPQAAMIVSELGEPTEEILRRADEANILWPRLFRSSAVEELMGYEGWFWSEDVDDFETGHDQVKWNPNNYSMYRNEEYFIKGAKEIIDRIRTSASHVEPQYGEELPSEINVIVAERSPSRFHGTLIKLPGRDAFVASITDMRSSELWRTREDYIVDSKNIVSPAPSEYLDENRSEIEGELREVVSWHNMIAELPEMDAGWTYQLEFGIDPVCLYQVRPFRKEQRAEFEVPPADRQRPAIVIGVTPPEGIRARIIKYPYLSYRDLSEFKDGSDSLFFESDVKDASNMHKLPNVRIAAFSRYQGLLEHGGVGELKKADIGFLAWGHLSTGSDGDWVTVYSDGKNFKIEMAND